MNAWLTKREVMELEGWTARTIERKTSAGELEWRWSSEVSRNGKKHREYALASLSQKAIQSYTKMQIRNKSILVMPTQILASSSYVTPNAASLPRVGDAATLPPTARIPSRRKRRSKSRSVRPRCSRCSMRGMEDRR
jgi:hypothetical protein